MLHTLRHYRCTRQRSACADERWKARGGAVSRTSQQAYTQSDWLDSSGAKLEGQNYKKSNARTISQITSFAQISYKENAASNTLQ